MACSHCVLGAQSASGDLSFRDFNWQMSYDGSKPIFRPRIFRGLFPTIMHKYEDMLTTGTLFNSTRCSMCAYR